MNHRPIWLLLHDLHGTGLVQYGRVLPCSDLRVLRRQEGVPDIHLPSQHTIVPGDRGCYTVQLPLCQF